MLNTNSFMGIELGNYRIVAKIASGGMGSVFKGEHIILTERIVAIKVLHTNLDSEEERNQFLQEARLLEKLKHPYILPLFDVGLNEGFPYLVTEYALNGSLRNRLNQQASSLLPIEESLTILSQIGQALQHAHQRNVVHRDLKPDNILFNSKGEALLADFGIATILSTATKNNITIIGTPAYMAPEQFQGAISRESDQYALGCIAYELFTGQKPFTASNFASFMFQHIKENPIALTQLNPQLPFHIEQAILKAIAKKRGDRHADISALITALYTSDISQTYVPVKNVPISEKSNKQPSIFKDHLNEAIADENATPHILLDIPPYIRQAITMLDSPMSTARKEAVASLAQTNHPAALEFLVIALQHPIQDVRYYAASALAQLKDIRAVPVLLEWLVLRGTNHGQAIEGLDVLGDEIIPILYKALNNNSKEIRRAAVESLSRCLSRQLGTSGIMSSKFWKDEKVSTIIAPIVVAVLTALQDLDLQDLDREVWVNISNAIYPLDRVMIFSLTALQDNDVEVRRMSAWILSLALPGLLSINKPDIYIPFQYYQVGIKDIVKFMRKAQKDKDEYVRSSITWTLNQIKK